MFKKSLSVFVVAILILSSLFGCGEKKEAEYPVPEPLKAMYQSFQDSIDTEYGYNIALELSTNKEYWSTPTLGGRNAGSAAEHKAADYLVGVMNDLGLKDVEKVGVQCDLWDNGGATLKVDDKEFTVYPYACSPTPEKGITAEVVYVGDGTMWDYEKQDVKGKIVLVDLDQRANYWVTYPMLEAENHGAVGMISANVGGFAQISEDALNSQDICAPISIPTVSISVKESKELQAKMNEGPVKATLAVHNKIGIDTGTTYNIIGKIPGKSSDNQILVGAHYDMHFFGFQDDNCAVGMVLTMAKAMLDSGYVPENDIVFCLHGAEEWGSFNTQYDWTVGAWEMINNAHPEWVGKTLAFINFELPAYKFDTYTSSYSAPEFYNMIDFFTNSYPLVPDAKAVYEDGVKTAGYQTYTYSDDFSYYASGVPCVINGFLLQDDMETPFPFYIDYYHSQMDLPDLFNEDVFLFNTGYYGAMAMYIDQNPALSLDFTAQYDRIAASLDEELLTSYGIDVETFKKNLENLKTTAEAKAAKVKEVNHDYMAAWVADDKEKMETLKQEGKALTMQNLEAFRFAQDAFLGLMYEKPIVPHEAPQENIQLCNQIIGCLEKGDVRTAVDEYAWQVNNVFEWYAMYFTPEVIKIQDNMFWGPENQDNLYWGTGKTFVKADVDAATRSLTLRQEEVGGDFTKEIEIYKAAIDAQSKLLVKHANQEIQDLTKLTEMLK